MKDGVGRTHVPVAFQGIGLLLSFRPSFHSDFEEEHPTWTRNPQNLVSRRSPVSREGSDTPCSKDHVPQPPADVPWSMQGKQICEATLPKLLPDLSMAPPGPWAFALTSHGCLILSTSQGLFPSMPTTSPCPGKCSRMQHHPPLPLAACPLLRTSIPASGCQAAVRRDLRPVRNTRQRCLFSSVGNPPNGSDTGIHKPV